MTKLKILIHLWIFSIIGCRPIGFYSHKAKVPLHSSKPAISRHFPVFYLFYSSKASFTFPIKPFFLPFDFAPLSEGLS